MREGTLGCFLALGVRLPGLAFHWILSDYCGGKWYPSRLEKLLSVVQGYPKQNDLQEIWKIAEKSSLKNKKTKREKKDEEKSSCSCGIAG
jgi:hypothetical protein